MKQSLPPTPSILVVDDTPANLQLLEGMLKESGYRVRPVTKGVHALRAAQIDPPDLILLDITMPEMDGYEVCRRLKANPATADIPVLFLSALTETENKIRAFEAGGVDYVSKPFQFAEVGARVRTHLRLRQRERELQESLIRERNLENLRDQLTHMIVHDMRSPLLALGLTLDLVRGSVGPQEANFLADAQVSLASLVEMISQVLDVSRMESKALELRQVPVDLSELAHEVMKAMAPLAGEIESKVQTAGPLLANADRDLVRRVITNLVCNAFKFAPIRGHVALRLLEQDGWARIEVVDDGRGIALEDQARIFEKFGQVEGDKKICGSGLGLTFAKMAIEAHGGVIGVASAPGKGSVFWFTLPLLGKPVSDSSYSVPPSASQLPR